MAFRLLDQKPQYRDTLGGLLAGGSLNFSITATSTPKNVYSSKTLGVSLGSTITLDSDARHSEDVWLAEDVAYRIIAKDVDNVAVWQLDDVRSLDTSVSVDLPDASDGTDGQALFTDGTDGGWYFDDVMVIPSQTGNSGKYLTTDGEALSWATFAEEDAPPEVSGTPGASGNYIVDGVMTQWGSDTCSSTGSLSVTKAVTFGTAFSGTPYHISVEPVLSGGVTSNSPPGFPATRYSSPSTTGFTAGFFVGEENNGGTDTINASIPFTWLAVGPAPA